MMYAIPITCFVAGLFAGLYAMSRWSGRTVLITATLLAVSIGWMILQGQQAQGFDGVGYAIGAFLMAAPTLFGLSAGSILVLLRRRRANRE